MRCARLVTQPRSHLFENEHARIVQRAIEAEALLSPALLTAPPNPAFPADNPLAMQLAMVARIIASRAELGPKRQVFFVSLGGFDTHDGILETHPGLLATVGSALAAFQTAMADLALQDQVTSFTASDFGRTLNSDGDGSDHGWGSMHFALGGAVNGRNFYGMPPIPANDGPDDVVARAAAAFDGGGPVRRHAGQVVRRERHRPGHRVSEPGELRPARPGVHEAGLIIFS